MDKRWPDAIIWKYPNEDITWGAQLIVHEYEMAVFFVTEKPTTCSVQADTP